MLEGHPCTQDPRGCPTDGGADAPSDARTAAFRTDGGDAMASTDGKEEAASPEFTSCVYDSDCVAVPQVGCCRLGFMVAVNRADVRPYQASDTCTESRPICPMYIVVDRRVPECDNATRRCTLISADRIACGGFVMNQHHCPQGYLCDVHGRPPDTPGVCVAEMDTD
jgi:hypothetical protein